MPAVPPRRSPSSTGSRTGPVAALLATSRRLGGAVDHLSFAAPVAYVYNPLIYAAGLHEAYLQRFGGLGARVLLLGMNPGPFGMAQTGVPFGDVAVVRDWLGLQGTVSAPTRVHPKRPVHGLSCERSEVSGTRLWGWARQRFVTPAAFFARFFVANYCPLVFVEESGRNRTPDKLPKPEQEPLFAVCDQAVREVAAALGSTIVVGVGAFAAQRAERALAALPAETRPLVTSILHPSPASPLANKGWPEAVESKLRAAGIELPEPVANSEARR